MPVDHTSITIPLSKYSAFRDFMLAALQPLGTKAVMDFSQYNSIGLGETLAYYWIVGMEMSAGEEAVTMKMLKGQHPAFTAESRLTALVLLLKPILTIIVGEEQVQHFHAAALKAGAADNGAPGPRPQYGPRYYAAFVTDPVFGFNLEVVCRT